MKEFWDERYSKSEFVYGELPNEFLAQELSKLTPGKILFPAEGEGRNSVYAATLGWDVHAFDWSQEGQKKALLLANKKGVNIDYKTGAFEQMHFETGSFDVIALIFAHFDAANKSAYHKKLAGWLRKGGMIIFEAFSKDQLAFNSKSKKAGGPKDIDMLFSTDELIHDFYDFEIIQIEQIETELEEGPYHSGKGSVVRFTGRKK